MADIEKRQPQCFALCARFNPLPQRYIHTIFGCLAIVNAYLMRQCLSSAITQLVVPRQYTKESIAAKEVCEADPDFTSGMANTGTRDWSQVTQGIVLSSFYFGYVITHVPGGVLADKYGSKWVLSLGILSTAFFSIITPIAIEIGDAPALITLRVLMGFGEGTTFPALSVLMADWVPEKERGILGSIIMGGGLLGTILSNSITGWMLHEYPWPVVFYVWGIVAILWFIFFTMFCYSSPLKHPCISEKEKQYLMEQIGDKSNKRRNLPPTPWKAILTSVPMWSLIICQIGHDWGFFVMASYLPKYMNDVLQFNIKKTGLLSSAPYVLMWANSIFSGYVADLLIKRQCMTTTNVRKMMTGIAAFGPAVFMVAASYSGCNRAIVIANFIICMGSMGSYYAGMKLTAIDMSPNYAGVVMALTNGIASLAGAISPTTVGAMTKNTTLQEWRNVFWLAFVMLTVTGIVFMIWGKSEIQPFDNPETMNAEKGK